MNRRIWTEPLAFAFFLAFVSTGCGAIASSNESATTELHQAVQNGDLEGLRNLLESGADVNAKDGKGRTALHIAAECDDVEMILLLVDNGADIHARDESNFTPRALAAGSGMQHAEEVLQELED